MSIQLPPPATAVELYLAAVLEEVQALRAELAAPAPAPVVAAPDRQVELRGNRPTTAPASPPQNRRR